MDEKILDKYIKGEATWEERQAVVEWLDADEAHVREMMALHKLYDITVMNAIGTEKKETAKPETAAQKTSRGRTLIIEVLKVAAVALLLLGVRPLVTPKQETGAQELYIPGGQRAELVLPDGSKVWLNANSRLIYPQVFGRTREVKLDGEAYFTVAHDQKHPFVVKTSTFDVKVLGTEFNVKAYGHSPDKQVDLINGSVELSGKAMGQRAYRMQPKESVRLTEGKMDRRRIADYDYFKWKEGLICFNDETIGEIFKKLELYYDIRIVVEKIDFLDEHYFGKFRTKDGVEQVLKVLQLEHKFTYVKDDNLNLITIK